MRHNDHSHKMRDDEPQRHHKEAYVQPNEKKIYIYIYPRPRSSRNNTNGTPCRGGKVSFPYVRPQSLLTVPLPRYSEVLVKDLLSRMSIKVRAIRSDKQGAKASNTNGP